METTGVVPSTPTYGVRLLKIAVIYLVIGLLMGIAMAMSGEFTLRPVHSHINLLGWASLALAGVIYVLFPKLERSRLAPLHFWLHNLGLPVMMVALGIYLHGIKAIEPLVGIASLVTTLGLILFAINLLTQLKSSDRR